MSDEHLILGPFENEVLMAVFRQRGDAYSNSVRKELRERVGRQAALGMVATTLRRLEDKGFLKSEVTSTPDVKRAGRPKRNYDLTAKGAAALNATRLRQNRLWEGYEKEVIV